MLTTLPASVAEHQLDDLLLELRRIEAALLETENDASNPEEGLAILQTAVERTLDYARTVRLAKFAALIDPSDPRFDDHDQLASSALYLLMRFSSLRGPVGSVYSEREFMAQLRAAWSEVNASNALNYRGTIAGSGPYPEQLSFGILTALEHEFQSMLRRLDSIRQCSDDRQVGFSILDRQVASDDLKLYQRAGSRPGIGWVEGLIGNQRVIVCCTGAAGHIDAKQAIRSIHQTIGVPNRGWIVAGVCAGTSHEWPIGTVLSSRGAIIGLVRKKSTGYAIRGDLVVEPMVLPGLAVSHIALRFLHRRPPEGIEEGIRVALPEAVPLWHVKFACTEHVVNDPADKQAIATCLRRSELVGDDEDFGIEMEGRGLGFEKRGRAAVVKAVCDYADHGKASWSEKTKALFQAYAAETAAEAVAMAVRMDSVSTLSPHPLPPAQDERAEQLHAI